MKRWFIIGLFVLLALAACVKGPEPVEGPTRKGTFSSELSAIDSLMWQRPDSALVCLLSYFDTCCAAEHDSHYAHLLLSELLYKNDYAQTNRAELHDAVVYFDSLAQNDNAHTRRRHCGLDPQSPSQKDILVFLAARAHYIYGVGYYEQDSAVSACKEYLKALEIMEDQFAEKELVGKKAQFMALSFTRMTEAFSDAFLHEQTIFWGKQALEYYKGYGASPWQVAWMLDEIGIQYEMIGAFDSATSYYYIGINTLDDNNSLTYRDIATRVAYCSYLMEKDIYSSLNQLFDLLSRAESEDEALSRHLTIAEIFYNEAQYDSAWPHLRKVFEDSKSVGSKKQAAEWLVEICKSQGRTVEAMEYADFLVPFANVDENKGFLKSQLTELCSEYTLRKHEKQQRQQYKENLNRGRYIVLVLASIILIGLLVYFYWIKRRHELMRLQNKTAITQLEAERYKHKMQQAALASRLKNSNDSLRSQSKTIKELQKKIASKEDYQPYYGNFDAFALETPCKEITNSLSSTNIKRISAPNHYPELALSSEQLLGLASATEKHFPGFEDYLRHLYPRISSIDLDICRLFLLGVNEKQAAILLSRDYSTIMEHVRKLKKAFHTEKSLRVFIKTGI